MELQDVPVTLVIKAPNQRMEDLTVDCMLGWTIRKLKQHLERVYPSKPKETEQRLIYSGKLLQDHLTLKEILHQYDVEDVSNTHTVHLVCSSSRTSASSGSASQKAKENSSSHTTTSSSSPAESTNHNMASTDTSPAPSGHNQGDGLRFRGHTPNMLPNQQSHLWGQMPYPPTTTPPPYSQEQYAWMIQQQQLYSQYMMQYMQYYQGVYGGAAGQPFGGGVIPPSPFGIPPTSVAPPFPQPQQPLQPQENEQPAAQPPAGAGNNAPRQNMRMNAQGGMEEDEDDEGDPRDWLHHTYFLMRLLTFLGILFFYSSFSRFLMVFAGSFAIYFFQKLRKYMQRAQRDREQQQQQQQPQQAQQEEQPEPNGDQLDPQPRQPLAREPANENGEAAGENAATVGPTATEGQTAAPVEDNGSRVTRLFVLVSRTIQLFFTSLVPAPAELLEPN